MRPSARHRSITLTSLLWTLSCCTAVAQQGVLPHRPDAFLVGGDISGLARIEQHGGVFSDKGAPGDLVAILANNGCNCFRLRLFVDPSHENLVVNDLDYTISLAKRIKDAGQRLLLDLHYSDTWADPGKQFTPAAWEEMDFQRLKQQVQSYTAGVVRRFKQRGVLPDIVQVGNEVTNGMLWPHGRIRFGKDGQEEPQSRKRFTELLKAGILGVRSGAGGSDNVQVMIHIDRGGDWPATERFFDGIVESGLKFDLIGLSFYPWWHGELSDLEANLRHTALRFNKPIVLVETGYPNRGPHWSQEPHMNWPITPQGQAEFLKDVVRTVRQIPKGLGAGVLYWYPEAIPVEGLHIWKGGSVGLFSESGELLPAARAFGSVFLTKSSTRTGESR